MSSRVTNHLPRISSSFFGMRSKSQGEMAGECGRCSNSTHPQRRNSCRTHSAYVVLHCRTELLHYPQDPDVHPERHVEPVTPGSPCSTVRSLF
ncbi:hypothetical protein TNCV_4767001 [Trichonephila clavipes]|nr:hypothetical protein TNCV_4767001 [Trichonephila clavipes]